MSDENQPIDPEQDQETTNNPAEDVNEAIDAAMEAESAATEPAEELSEVCLLYTSPSPRDQRGSRMPSSA